MVKAIRSAETKGGDRVDQGSAFDPNLTEDTLVALSLLSPDLERRAAEYCSAVEGGELPDWWSRRREEMRPWLAERLAELRGGDEEK